MLLMDNPDLMLVGTAPAAVSDIGRPASTTKPLGQTYSTASQPATPSNPLHQTYTSQRPDSGRVNRFFEENGHGRVNTTDKNKVSHGQRSMKGKNKKKHNPSYVDDTLFGSRPLTSDWPSPFAEKPKSMTFVLGGKNVSYSPENYTTPTRGQSAHKRGSQTERPGSSKGHLLSEGRPGSARSLRPSSSHSINKSLKRQPMKIKHTPSYVDDLLFGPQLAKPDFEPPWKNQKEPKAFNFDYTNYKSQSTTQSKKPSEGRISCSPSCVPGSRPTSAQKSLHSASYVDETLFGPKLADPGWAAPWEDSKDKNRQMNIYDAFEHKVTIHHEDVAVVKPKSSVSMTKKKPPSPAKPAWR